MKCNGLCGLVCFTMLIVFVVASEAEASDVVIAQYGFPEVVPATEPPTIDLTSSDTDLATTASPVAVFGDVDLGAFAGDNRAFIRAEDTANDASSALASADYLSFEITGASFDIQAVSFDYAVTNSFTDAFYGTAVYGSVDDFASSFLIGSQTLQASGTSGVAQDSYTLDTSSLSAFTSPLSDVEIRFYFFDFTDDPVEGIGPVTANHVHSVDNIAVSVPEPRSLAIIGVGALLLARRPWRR